MNYRSTQTSIVQRQGEDYVEVPRSISNSTRMIEMGIQKADIQTANTPYVGFIPLYNLFNIALGQNTNQRVGSSIYIHRIEFDFSITANPTFTLQLPETTNTLNSVNVFQDPRIRIVIANQRRSMKFMPVDATSPSTGYAIGAWPYYSPTSSVNYPEGISPPITNTNIDSGMLGYADPRYYDVEYDDVKNIYENGITPLITFCQQIIVRKRFDYPLDSPELAQLQFSDDSIQKAIPQVWIYFPSQKSTTNVATYSLRCSMRMHYDCL